MITSRYFLLAGLFLWMPIICSGQNNILPDYSKKSSWLSLPAEKSKMADVFYVYPVSRQGGGNEPSLCPIDHPEMVATAKIVYQLQASAFDSLANVYAPFYRQLDAQTVMRAGGGKKRDDLLDSTSGADITVAFDYYIKHFNKGRPFVLVGHSLGAMLVKRLLFTYMKDHPEVYKRMVAAYVIGYSITGQEIAQNPHVRFAKEKDDSGVVISYNTEAPNHPYPNPTAEKGALVINPISWKTDTSAVPASLNLGSYIYKNGNYLSLPKLADAKIDPVRGTIICSTVNPKEYISAYGLFPEGNYHSFDFAFYYKNLRVNCADRITAFLNKK